MKKIIIYYNFVLIGIMTISGFLGARNYAELFSAILFYPLAMYFLSLILPQRKNALIIPSQLKNKGKLEVRSSKSAVLHPIKDGKKFDVDRRMFIKLIGSAGISLFLFSIFSGRAHGAFFGSVPGPGTVSLKDTTGAQIDPAKNHPTDGYKIAELDDSSPAYYGFVDKDGAWFILKEDSAGAYRYIKGSSSFSTNWTNRASLTYDYYHNIF